MSETELLKYLQTPRKIGTEQNRITQKLLAGTLKERGFDVKQQDFLYEPLLNFKLIVKIFSLLIYAWGIFNLILIFFSQIDLLWSLYFWFLSLLLYYLVRTTLFHDFDNILTKNSLKTSFDTSEKAKFKREGLKIASNIYIIKEPIENPTNLLILATNFDSASLSLKKLMEKSNKIEIILVPILAVLLIIQFFLFQLNDEQIILLFLSIVIILVLFFLFIASIVSFLSFKQNKSPGAINNGSSVLCLIKLLETLKGIDLKNTLLLTAFFNGKEENMIGSKAFCDNELLKILEQYNIKRRNVSFISLESIGAKLNQKFLKERISFLIPFLYHQNLKYYLKNFSIFYDQPIKEKIFAIHNSDHIPFLVRNYQAVNLFREYNEANTPNDIIENISEKNINSTICLLEKLIKAKDENLKFEIN